MPLAYAVKAGLFCLFNIICFPSPRVHSLAKTASACHCCLFASLVRTTFAFAFGCRRSPFERARACDFSEASRRPRVSFSVCVRGQAVRVSGKAVILCGDLNIAARGADVPWQQALLRLDFLIGARLVSSVAPSRRRGEQAEGATNAVATMKAAAALEGAEVGESVEQAVGEALGETSMAAAPSGPLDSIAQPRLENDGGEKGDGEGERFDSGRAECAGVGGNDGLGDDDDDDDGDASGKADPCASAWSSPAVSAAERRVLSALGSTAPLVAEKLRRTCGARRRVYDRSAI
eukprot:5016300-Pleurochrysis_carterae.AAC.3